MPSLTRRTSAATAAEKRAAETADTSAETAAAKRTRLSAAAAGAEAADPTAFAQFKTAPLGLPWRERAGYLDKSFASDPDEAAEAAARKIADLHAHLPTPPRAPSSPRRQIGKAFANCRELYVVQKGQIVPRRARGHHRHDRAACPVPIGPDHRDRGGASFAEADA